MAEEDNRICRDGKVDLLTDQTSTFISELGNSFILLKIEKKWTDDMDWKIKNGKYWKKRIMV